jgi:hypothetical protein
MTESVGNNEMKNPVSANYETKNSNTFQLLPTDSVIVDHAVFYLHKFL